MIYDQAGDTTIRDLSDPAPLYSLVLFGQFVAWLLIYLVIDRYLSTDTGAKRILIGAAADNLDEVDKSLNADVGNKLLDNASNNGIQIRNLVKKFGDFTALKRITLDIEPNRVTCLLGHNGAGKTTLIDIMTGF